MKSDYLKEKKELISIVLLGFSVVLVIIILVKISSFFDTSADAKSIVTAAIEQNTEDANEIEKYFTEYKKLADALKNNNLFAPPPPRQNPVSEISGIFGDEVIIRDKLYKVGDKVGDAKIVAIAPTEVTIEWDGKTKTFSPMDSGGSSGPGGPGGPGGPRGSASSGPPRPGGGSAQMVTVQSQGGPTGGPGVMGGFGGPRGFMNMSDAERRERMERYRNMSEAERERFRAEMRERFGGRPPGFGGDRGSGSDRRRGR